MRDPLHSLKFFYLWSDIGMKLPFFSLKLLDKVLAIATIIVAD